MSWEFSLEGIWNFSLDNAMEEENFDKMDFTNHIQIPGILQAQGYGEDITETTPWVSSLHDKLWYQREEYKMEGDELNVPFLSQPPKHYIGPAWYQKKFNIPSGLEGSIFYFEIECVKWKTSLWLDSHFIGTETSLCAPHSYCLGPLTAGEHSITVCVDNSFQYPYRPDGHMVSDALGATWNGMVGNVRIKAVPAVHIENVRVYPETETKRVFTEVIIRNHTGESQEIQLQVNEISKKVIINDEVQTVTFEVFYSGEVQLWDEYLPELHQLLAVLTYRGIREEKTVTFGFRRIEVKAGEFLLNDRPTFFRGTHFGGDFPLTGYPSADTLDWKKIIRICKQWGLNYIRFHSYCPPKAAFIAADEEGIYLQVECGMWNKFYDGCEMNDVLWKETIKILDTFGNHPSFVMLSPSNEPGSDWLEPLTEWVKKCKENDSRRIYTAQSGWPYPMEPHKIEGMDYVYFHRSGFGIEPGGTIRNSQGWHGKDYRLSVKGIRYPVISHELGQWCSYPDYDVIEKFTGYLKPGNYKAFQESARRQGVLEQHKEFSYLSGKMKVQLYKEDIEATFRTPHIYGFELLELHDYLGQGTALVGLLDPFWEDKGFVTAEEFRSFCSETVPLLRISKRVYTIDEELDCLLEFCHYGRETIKDARIYWEIRNPKGEAAKAGEFTTIDLPLQKNFEIGRLQVSLKDLEAPANYEIVVGIRGTSIKNSWNIWLYPTEHKELGTEKVYNTHSVNKVLYTQDLTEAIKALQEGRKVIYSPLAEHQRLDSPPLSFKTAFWNSQMGPTYARGMGLVIDKEHPALALFPTKEYQEWQWEEIIQGAYGLNLSNFPKELVPIVQPIDDFTRNYRMGMILEAKVLKGSLLIVTADMEQELDKRPAARQLKESLFAYVASENFSPKVDISEEVLVNAFYPRNIMLQNKTKAKLITNCLLESSNQINERSLSRMNQKFEDKAEDYSKIYDGDPNTFLATEQLKYPFTIEMEVEKELSVKGLIYMPRQNEREHKGDIKGVKIESFIDNQWSIVFEGELVSSYAPKEILFREEIKTNKVRFTALYGFSGKGIHAYTETKEGWIGNTCDYEETTAAIAELLLIPAGDMMIHMKKAEEIQKSSGVWQKENSTARSATKEIDN